MADNSHEHNFGRISRLYPDDGGIYFTLTGGQTAMNPVSGYYRLETAHGNYGAMAALLYWAANPTRIVKVQTAPDLNPDGFAVVSYLVVDL